MNRPGWNPSIPFSFLMTGICRDRKMVLGWMLRFGSAFWGWEGKRISGKGMIGEFAGWVGSRVRGNRRKRAQSTQKPGKRAGKLGQEYGEPFRQIGPVPFFAPFSPRGFFGVRWLDAALAVPFFLSAPSTALVQNAKRPRKESGVKPPHSKEA